MQPTFFATPAAFRAWLTKHHKQASELLVGFHKRDTKRPSITWPEAVDQALAFGWIDGVRRRVDGDSYCIRFTPRRAGSKWSAVNIERVAELEAQGLMRPAGRKAFEARSEAKSRTYSYEQDRAVALDREFEAQLKSAKKAWSFFRAQAPSYQRKVIHWVMGAKAAEVRIRRLEKVIAASAASRRL